MLPEDCFWQTIGRPIDRELLARVRASGLESLCEFFLSHGLNEQSRYKLVRAFFSVTFSEFRALERRVAASVGESCTVYIALLGEGTAAWRPVNAERVAPGIFRLSGAVPDSERWEFGAGELVRCAGRVFSGGETGLVAFQKAEAEREPSN